MKHAHYLLAALILVATASAVLLATWPVDSEGEGEHTVEVRYYLNYYEYADIIDVAYNGGYNGPYNSGTQDGNDWYVAETITGDTATLKSNPQDWDTPWLKIKVNETTHEQETTLGKTLSFYGWKLDNESGIMAPGSSMDLTTITDDYVNVYAAWKTIDNIIGGYKGQTVVFPELDEDNIPVGMTRDDFIGWNYNNTTYQPGEVVVIATKDGTVNSFDITPVFRGMTAHRTSYSWYTSTGTGGSGGVHSIWEKDYIIGDPNLNNSQMSPAIVFASGAHNGEDDLDYRYMSLRDGTIYYPGIEYDVVNLKEDMVLVYIGADTTRTLTSGWTTYNRLPSTQTVTVIIKDPQGTVISQFTRQTGLEEENQFELPMMDGIIGYVCKYTIPDSTGSTSTDVDVLYEPGSKVYAHCIMGKGSWERRDTYTYTNPWTGTTSTQYSNTQLNYSISRTLEFTALIPDMDDTTTLVFKYPSCVTVYDPVEGNITGNYVINNRTVTLQPKSTYSDHKKYVVDYGASLNLTFSGGGPLYKYIVKTTEDVLYDNITAMSITRNTTIIPVLKLLDVNQSIDDHYFAVEENVNWSESGGTPQYTLSVSINPGQTLESYSAVTESSADLVSASINNSSLDFGINAENARGTLSFIVAVELKNGNVTHTEFFRLIIHIVGPIADKNS